MSSFSTLPDARFRSSSGQSPTPSGITQGLDGLSLAVEGPSNNTADGIAQLMAIAGGAANVVQDAGQIAARRAQYESQLEFEVAQRAQDVQTLAMRKAEQDRREGKQADQAADAQYERFVARERVSNEAMLNDAGTIENMEIADKLISGDPETIKVLDGSFNERLAWVNDVIDARHARLNIVGMDDRKAKDAASLLRIINDGRETIKRYGEAVELKAAVGVLEQSESGAEFAYKNNAVLDGLDLTSRREGIATLTLPALQAVAATGNVPKLNAFIEASGLVGNDEYTSNLQTLRNTAEANAIKLRSAQQNETESQFRVALVRLERGDPSVNPDLLNAQIGEAGNSGAISSRQFDEFTGTLIRVNKERARKAAQELQQSQFDEAKQNIINETTLAIFSGNAFQLMDTEIRVPAQDGGAEKVQKLTWEARIDEAMPLVFKNIEDARVAQAMEQGLDEATARRSVAQQVLSDKAQVAAGVDYVPDEWRRTLRMGISQAQAASTNPTSTTNEAAPAIRNALQVYSTLKAASPRMAMMAAGGEEQQAFYDSVLDQLAVPDTSLDQAIKFATTPRAASSTLINANDKEVANQVSNLTDDDYGRAIASEHVLRIANARVVRGETDTKRALKEATAYVQANSIVVNNVPVYLGNKSALAGMSGESGKSWVRGVEYWMDDIAKDYGDNSLIDGKPATGKDLTLWRDPDNGRFIVYDKRTRTPLVPRDGKDAVNRLTFTWTDIVRKRVDPVQREEQERRAMQEKIDKESLLNRGIVPFTR